jgi:HNH endonuclease/NUMOD4 motif
MNTPEQWLPVVGYEGLYSVSSLGRIRSEVRRVKHPMGGIVQLRERILRDSRAGRGYRKVALCREGTQTTRAVHKIVAEAFIGPCPEGQEVAHDDGVKSNNRASNIRYDTPVGNAADKLRHGTDARGERSPNAKVTAAQVLAIRRDQSDQRIVAARYGIRQSTVSNIRTRKTWAHLQAEPQNHLDPADLAAGVGYCAHAGFQPPETPK